MGVDRSAPMIDLARSKAVERGLTDTTFEVGEMSRMPVQSASVDAVVSRFALLYEDFADVLPSLAETARVLRPGGAFSLAVWDRAELNTLIALFHHVASDVPGADALPDPFAYDVLATPGHRAALLSGAGFAAVEETAFTFDYRVPDQAALVEVLHTSPYGPHLDALEPAERTTVEKRLATHAAGYRQSDGSYQIPITCRLLWGRR
uniref:class I SAM-dependent methyltransferase n=1 Tax=Paractinoplanes polyasparticus TaxID=2856853 RepID=UPI001C85F0FC|nr:class I SAM-dependent methyltransferase [Actinoplanes polyasparticus]